jgi:hypothetical protein
LPILQGVIGRMASNSSNCKAWCIGLVSAILVLVADKQKSQYSWVAAVPIIMFWMLDAYYLALERSFRASYNSFLTKLHAGTATIEDVFAVQPGGRWSILWSTFVCLFAPSVVLVYACLGVMTEVARQVVLK